MIELINNESPEDNNNFDYNKYVIKKNYINNRLSDYITGNIPKGYRIGFKALDSVIVCKINEMLACVGKKGRGKTTIEEILLLLWAISNNLNFCLALQENDEALEKKNLLGYLLGKDTKEVFNHDKELYNRAVKWLDERFIFLECDTFKEITETVEALIKNGKKIDGLFCDPVNSIESGWYQTGNQYQDDKKTAAKLLKFSKNVCTVFLSQHPTMLAQRSSEDVNSYSAEGGHFLNKSHFTWAINRDNGSNENRISVDNVRNKYTGGSVTDPDYPLILKWHPYKIDIINNDYGTVEDIVRKLVKKHNPFDEIFIDDLPNKIETPTTSLDEAFGNDEDDMPF